MPKLLQFDQDARRSLASGVHVLAQAVRGTLGPKGRFVVLDRPIGRPVVSNDGVTIASEIELPDRFENMGVQLAREAASQTNEVAGDGTTSSTLLADALVQQSQQALETGVNPVDLCRFLDRLSDQAMSLIAQERFPLTDPESMVAVATLAAGDSSLGAIIAEAFQRLGVECHIELTAHAGIDHIEYRGGMEFDRGYISHHMVTDPRRMTAELVDAAILITDQKITNSAFVEALADALRESGQRGLLIVAEDYTPDVIARLVTLHDASSFAVAAIRAPEFGPWRKAALEDLAIFTGAKFFARDLDLSPDFAQIADLGHAGHIFLTQDRVTISDGRGLPEAVEGRKSAIREQLEITEQPFERDKLNERLTRLAGNTAVIFVGGHTPIEQKARMGRAEDAINAVRSALKEGTVLGGGVTYIHVAQKLQEHIHTNDDHPSLKVAQRIFCRALEEPLRALAENTGVDPEEAVQQVAAHHTIGLNALTGTYEDFRRSRIFDPLTSVTQALANAVSVAKIVLNTTVLVCDLLDVTDPTTGPARGGGEERFGMD
jgi:chaperonin GroEL